MEPTDKESRTLPIEPREVAVVPPAEPVVTHDPYRALRFRDFRFLLIGTFIGVLGEQMLTVAIGWELYERTGSALALGAVGLVQIIPITLLSLPAGHLADRLNRKYIVIAAQSVLCLASLGLFALSLNHGALLLIYACLFLIGTATAFNSPASSTLLPQTVPAHMFENAATWESSSWQMAAVFGPALGGFAIALSHSATIVYAVNAATAIILALMIALIKGKRQGEPAQETTTWHAVLEGMKFLKSSQIILAAITLDLFAVLLGGATTLLPIYARDILHVGPTGLGWMRAAPSIGAVCVSLYITHRPPFKKAGRTLLWAVAVFGLVTFIFGISHWFLLSLLMLFVLGGMDNISVVIRSTLLLTRTPDAMRGRISAVNYIFVGASNELGGFESGLVAQLFGPMISVAGGGIGTILVVICVALLWPEMRRLGPMSETRQEGKDV